MSSHKESQIPLPPPHLNYVGGGDFKRIGEIFLQHFIQLGKLMPDEKVLDVGCGIGRMAIPLAKYLDARGSYEGFDIVKEAIEWCNNNISKLYPRFVFKHIDIYNKHYNSKSTFKPTELTFPYEDGTFDFVFLTSVFTHMLPEDVEKYTSEIYRVLKNGGRCLVTFFLLNQETLRNIENGVSMFNFKRVTDIYSTTDLNMPEIAIAYDEEFVKNLFQKYKLIITNNIYYGVWSGRKNGYDCQDIIIIRKE